MALTLLVSPPLIAGAATSGCGTNLTLQVASTGDINSADGSQAHPYRTITAALQRARTLRSQGCLQPITIRVAPGTYRGTNLVGSSTEESLPILVDVSNLTLLGSTVLATDGRGLPTGNTSDTTTLEPDPILTQPVGDLPALILVAPTGPPVSDVVISGFELKGSSTVFGLQTDLGIDRVQRFTVQGDVINGGSFGMVTRGSSGLIAGNYMTRAGAPGMALEGGNASFPAKITVQGNRSISNGEGGAYVAGGADLAFPTVPGVPINTANFSTLDVTIVGNDLSNNAGNKAQAGFGLRVLQAQPTQSPFIGTTHVSAAVKDNTFDRDALGVVIDTGFPYRADPVPFVGTLMASFSGNNISNSTMAAAVVTFNRYTATLCAKELPAWKYLQDSTFTINDPDNELKIGEPNGATIDNPPNDPIDGRVLRNQLTIDGNVQPSTTTGLQTRLLTSPTCA